MLKHNSDDFKPVTPRNVHRTWKSSVKSVISSSRVCHVIDTPISTVTSLCTNVGTCPQFHSEFDPEEAEQAGAFDEDALSAADALESSIDY